MAFLTTVVVQYRVGDISAERSTEFTLETDAPPTRGDIGALVAGEVELLVTIPGSEIPGRGNLPYTWTFEVESVFRT